MDQQRNTSKRGSTPSQSAFFLSSLLVSASTFAQGIPCDHRSDDAGGDVPRHILGAAYSSTPEFLFHCESVNLLVENSPTVSVSLLYWFESVVIVYSGQGRKDC